MVVVVGLYVAVAEEGAVVVLVVGQFFAVDREACSVICGLVCDEDGRRCRMVTIVSQPCGFQVCGTAQTETSEKVGVPPKRPQGGGRTFSQRVQSTNIVQSMVSVVVI